MLRQSTVLALLLSPCALSVAYGVPLTADEIALISDWVAKRQATLAARDVDVDGRVRFRHRLEQRGHQHRARPGAQTDAQRAGVAEGHLRTALAQVVGGAH